MICVNDNWGDDDDENLVMFWLIVRKKEKEIRKKRKQVSDTLEVNSSFLVEKWRVMMWRERRQLEENERERGRDAKRKRERKKEICCLYNWRWGKNKRCCVCWSNLHMCIRCVDVHVYVCTFQLVDENAKGEENEPEKEK